MKSRIYRRHFQIDGRYWPGGCDGGGGQMSIIWTPNLLRHTLHHQASRAGSGEEQRVTNTEPQAERWSSGAPTPRWAECKQACFGSPISQLPKKALNCLLPGRSVPRRGLPARGVDLGAESQTLLTGPAHSSRLTPGPQVTLFIVIYTILFSFAFFLNKVIFTYFI